MGNKELSWDSLSRAGLRLRRRAGGEGKEGPNA
jgi:hypothetical protein